MVHVIKRDGRKEEFNRWKILRTCKRAGAPQKVAEKIAEEVEKRVYDGITTGEVLKMVIELLEKHAYSQAARYDLKMALLRLGPAGYEFEKFIARLLEEYDYDTTTNVYVKGKCVTHEVDVIAEKDGRKYMVECKFHNIPGIYTGLKEVMYTYARFLDILDGFRDGKNDTGFVSSWIFTNTKFSGDAKRFAECRGVMLTGWRYPEGRGIESLLEAKNLYPITVLRISRELKESLINAGYVFCRDLLRTGVKDLSRVTGVKLEKIKMIVEEARRVVR
jgi:hypothetical protein